MDLKILAAVAVVWVTIFVVPVIVYGSFSAVTGLQPPGDSPALFMASTAVVKLGTAIAFVALFVLARDVMGERLWLYVGICGLMFVIGELGQAVAPTYSWKEAIAGIISETIYFPVSGLVLIWLVRS